MYRKTMECGSFKLKKISRTRSEPLHRMLGWLTLKWTKKEHVIPSSLMPTRLGTNLPWGGFRGGSNPPPPPNGQSHSIKYSTTNVFRYAQALIYIAKSLVVVVSSKQVVKPLSRQAVVQPEVLHLARA